MALVTRDPRTGVFSVDLEDGEVARTAQFDDSHLVDLAADGRVLSIEILTPDDPRIEDMASAFGFEDRVREIFEAIDAAFAPATTVTAGGGFKTVSGVVNVFGGEMASADSAGPRIQPRKITLTRS